VLFEDVLLNITGGSIGRSCLITEENINANVNQHVCIIRSKKKELLPKYLHYYLISSTIQNQIKVCQTGGNREELNFEQIGNFWVSLPPFPEQQAIANYLDSKTQKIDAAIARLDQEKVLQEKYKQSLINEAVTGKIDVRDWNTGNE
jgi:type I restriction enzyme S subunit